MIITAQASRRIKKAFSILAVHQNFLEAFFFFFNVDARSRIQTNYIQISEGVVQYSNQYFLTP